jgi:dipeptidyl aminopeptidase/acylaminoacyl peptidase
MRPGETDDSILHAVPTQLTSAPGLQGEPALSPDASQVAFVSDEGGTPHIWLVDANGAATLQLTSGEDPDHDPAWLPDGSAILFTRIRNGRQGIWRVPSLGGVAHCCRRRRRPAVSPDGPASPLSGSSRHRARVFVAPLSASRAVQEPLMPMAAGNITIGARRRMLCYQCTTPCGPCRRTGKASA